MRWRLHPIFAALAVSGAFYGAMYVVLHFGFGVFP